MTNKGQTTPFILNLTGALSPEWQTYVQKQKITIVDQASDNDPITHILVKGDADFFQISFDYKTVESDIKLIALGSVLHVDEFTKANGKLVLAQSWFKSLLGFFILDKFFQEHSGMTLTDSFPKFQELGSFNITNLYNTGEYLDRMIYQAFENGLSALSIKSYFDHLIMYLACLRAEGKLGLPIEVTYGSFEGVFGLQVHFFAEKLSLIEVTESLSRQVQLNPQDEVLKLALTSAEFFDLTYLDNVKKAVVTALWNKSSDIRTVNKGFLLSSLEKTSHLSQFPVEGLTDYNPAGNSEIPDLTSRLLGSVPATEAVTVLKGTDVIKEESTRVMGTKDLPEARTVVAGTKDGPEARTMVSGGKAEAETKTVVSGSRDEKLKDKTTIVKGQAEEDKGDLSITSLGQEALLQQEIQKLQKQVEAKDDLVAKILAEKEKQAAVLLEKSNKETEHLKSKLVTIGNELKVMRDAQAKVESVRCEATLSLTDEQTDKLLGNTPEKLLKKLQMESQQKELLFQKELEKLQREKINRESMLTKLKESMTEVMKKKDQQIDDLLRKVENNLSAGKTTLGDFEFRDFPDKKKTDEKVDNANEETIRLYQDASQKNVIFQRSIDQLERETAAKDMMLDKNRENFNHAIEKRDTEIKDLKERLNKMLQEGNKESNTQQLVHLERQNQYLTKMNDSYKVKITTLMAEIETLKTPDAKDDAKRLQVMAVQNKNMIESLKRDLQRYQDKSAADLSTITNLRGEKNKLETDLKKATMGSKVEKDNGNSEADLKKAQLQIQTLENQLKDSGTKLKDLEAKLADARKTQSTHNNAQDGQVKSKISHLEASIKKLTQDLIESRNLQAEGKKEVNKVRLEKTAIQNELEKLKKESEKSKAAAAASPNKPNPGGKAA